MFYFINKDQFARVATCSIFHCVIFQFINLCCFGNVLYLKDIQVCDRQLGDKPRSPDIFDHESVIINP